MTTTRAPFIEQAKADGRLYIEQPCDLYSDEIKDQQERVRVLDSIIKAMARFFWFTIEFGLMRHDGELKVYNSGLLAGWLNNVSPGEPLVNEDDLKSFLEATV